MKTKSLNVRVIATDGGLILQLCSYAHDYSDEAQAAFDWLEFQRTRSTDGGEGHDHLAAQESVDARARAHGIREYDEEDVRTAVDSPPDNGPLNFRKFVEELRRLQEKSRRLRV